MFVAGNFLAAVAAILNIVLRIYSYCVLAAVIVSWVAPRSVHPAIIFLRSITEPIFYRIRRALPFLYQSGIDFTPIVVFFGIGLVRMFVVSTLYQAAARLQ
jgi:YggT family protein